MTVAQVAKKTGATPDAIRHYCRLGLLRPKRDRHTGYKRFGDAEIKLVEFISKAKTLGFSLRQIAEIIRKSTAGQTPCPYVRTIVAERILTNDRALTQLRALQSRLKDAATRWAAMPDGIPDGDAVCHLIESFEVPHERRKRSAARSAGSPGTEP